MKLGFDVKVELGPIAYIIFFLVAIQKSSFNSPPCVFYANLYKYAYLATMFIAG